ncbi:unnamed protein product [Microthlaspi erraticum]|uniref:Uncharacterized protein n=1 Tax=Microthlaspi erraticum TaxID=1685480 RepID=A0A6D2IFA9_9BRAS|nr:unnamed protein product [Microthlaspi erraticum]
MKRASVVVAKRRASSGTRNCSTLSERRGYVRTPAFTLRSLVAKGALACLGWKIGIWLASLRFDSGWEEAVQRHVTVENNMRMEKERLEASRIQLREYMEKCGAARTRKKKE